MNTLANISVNTAILFGACIGLIFSALLFFTVPVYHDYLVWSWTHFWFLAPFGLIGVAFAYFTD